LLFVFVKISLLLLGLPIFVFSVFHLCSCFVVSTSAIICVERLISEMTCYVSSGTLNVTHSVTHE